MTPSPTRPPTAAASIRTQVRAAVAVPGIARVASGALPGLARSRRRPAVEVERPADPVHGDFASNLAMKLARPYRMAPLAIAAALAAELTDARPRRPGRDADRHGRGRAARLPQPAPPRRRARGDVAAILADPAGLGPGRRRSAPRSVNVEFVSANPTGPLHVGNARGAFVGDLLCRVLEAGGQRVTREYYFNDSGGQIRNLGASVAALRRGEPVPEDGYQGDYVDELAADASRRRLGRGHGRPAPTPTASSATGRPVASARGSRPAWQALGVHFDVWTSEARLHDEGWVARAVERLRERGHVYEQDGAIWFRSTAFGDDKDRVIYRSNGEPTYFAADIGYVTEKFSRGFDHLIYIWGADHHGTVARVRNAAEAMGYDREAVQMLLYSWVRFVRDGEEVSMSKRAGEFITLDELLAEVGVDAARWFFASRAATTEIDFDIELAKKQSNENPVYYVQYAHARIASILRKAADAGLAPAAGRGRGAGGRARGRPGAGGRPLPRGRRGRRRGRGDAGHHRLRDRAGHDVPRLLPRRAGRGRRRARAVGGAARPGRGGADHAGQRARAAGDLRARVDVSRPAAGPARPGALERLRPSDDGGRS